MSPRLLEDGMPAGMANYKPTAASASTTCGSGTLESIVSQATHHDPQHKFTVEGGGNSTDELLYRLWCSRDPAAQIVTPDALVPCSNINSTNKISNLRNENQEHSGTTGDHYERDRMGEREGVKGAGKSLVPTKRRRVAANHNLSERKRRDRINQRIKTLQKMVPNSSKNDKASVLDEVIEYVKQLQAQVHIMSKGSMSAKIFPLAMQHHLQVSTIPAGMGMRLVMDMNDIRRVDAAVSPVIPWTATAGYGLPVPHPGLAVSDRVLALCQSQRVKIGAHARRPTLYQQLQQPLDLVQNINYISI